MNKLELLASTAILGLMIASIISTASLMLTTVHATTLPPQLEAADLDNSGNVTLADLTGFASIYAWNSTNPGWNSPIQPGWRNASEADFNSNSRIDLGDLVTMAYCYMANSTA
jgi:hypothetical protein